MNSLSNRLPEWNRHRRIAYRLVAPKDRVDSQFYMRLMHHAKVVAEELCQHFVFHGHIGSTAHMVAELGLYHREGRFRIAPLTVVFQEVVAAEVVVEKHLLPQRSRFSPLAVRLERDVSRPADPFHQRQ